MADYEVSAHYVSSLAKVLAHQGLLHVCPGPAAPALENPWAHWWWSGGVVESVFVAVHARAGDKALREVGEALVRQHVVPSLVPAVTWLLWLSGVRPSALFSRLDLLAKTLLRGVDFGWTPDGPNGGTVRVHYPAPAQSPAVMASVWRGIFEQIFLLTDAEGEVEEITQTEGIVVARVRWS